MSIFVDTIALFFLITVLLYFICMLYFGKGIFKTVILPSLVADSSSFITVVVCFRNEEKHLDQLLQALVAQNYPASLFEIVLYDDASEDHSPHIIDRAIANFPNHRIVCRKVFLADERVSPKKLAINDAAQRSRANLIVVTDADCIPGTDWLRSLAACYHQDKALMIAGPVTLFAENSWLGKLQQLEMFALGAVSAGAIGNGKPVMCNAANMAFDRKTFVTLNPYRDNMSIFGGDDVFLLHAISVNHSNRIKFITQSVAVVQSSPVKGLNNYIQQKVRWSSKTKHYQHKSVILFALIVLLSNSSILLSPILIFLVGFKIGILLIGMIMGMKFLADTLITLPYSKLIEKKINYFYLLLWQFPEAALTCFVAFKSMKGNYVWKDRKQRI